MRRGRSRVGAERLEPTSSRIILRLRRLSVAVLAEGGWVDSVPLATRQGQLDLTACDPCGTRRVGQAWWGGAGLPSDAPGRSRRAQRARHALPEAGRVPCFAPLRRASSISPPAIGSERDASDGRCRAVVLGGAGSPRVVEALSQRRARAAQAAHAPGAAAPPMALRHEPAGADERSARPGCVRGARCSSRRGRSVAHWRSDGTTRPRGRSRRPRARAVGIFAGGDKKRG